MNRRRLIAAFAIAIMLAIFAVTKSVASWRPVRVGALGFDLENFANPDVRVGKDYVVAGGRSAYARFDLQTGARKPLRHADFLIDDGWLGQLAVTDHVELQIRKNGGATTTYKAPTHFIASPGDVYEVEHDPDAVRVTPRSQRVEMVLDGAYYRWNQTSRVLERDVPLVEASDRVQALARDGETVVSPTIRGIFRNSTRPGQAPAKVALQGVEAYKERQVSPFGAYVIYYAFAAKDGANALVLQVVDAQSGRGLWSSRWKFDEVYIFNNANAIFDDAVFSPDETRVALPLLDRNQWEIHDTKSGALLCTVPRLPGVQCAAFAPDNATLYSVAGGVLYRQRAR